MEGNSSVKVLFLTRGEFSIYDTEFEELIELRSWFMGHNGYAHTCKLKNDPDSYPTRITLHSYIWFIKTGVWSTTKTPIDHINRNRLDNRYENLRMTTPSINIRNSKSKKATNAACHSKYIGLYRAKPTHKWTAQAAINGKTRYLGTFETEELAAQAYDDAVWDFCNQDPNLLNFPFRKLLMTTSD